MVLPPLFEIIWKVKGFSDVLLLISSSWRKTNCPKAF